MILLITLNVEYVDNTNEFIINIQTKTNTSKMNNFGFDTSFDTSGYESYVGGGYCLTKSFTLFSQLVAELDKFKKQNIKGNAGNLILGTYADHIHNSQ